MKFSSYIAGASLAGVALSSPIASRQATNIDNTILQFALTLEHLENVFYEGAIKNFTAQDFANAGYGSTYYNNLKYIAHDEQVHVQTLTAALQANGQTPVAACQYSFPYTDVNSFITLSSILEGVGTSAYLGGAPLITSKYYLTVAGSILATEALHTSYQRAAIGEVPMANPFETPLNPNPVYTLAAAFIVSCPASNPPLPFVAFPSLTATSGTCVAEEPSMKKRNWEGKHICPHLALTYILTCSTDWSSSSSSDPAMPASSTSAAWTGPAHSSMPAMSSSWSTMPSKATQTWAASSSTAWNGKSSPSVMPTNTHAASSTWGAWSGSGTVSATSSATSGAGCALPSKTACAAAAGSTYTFTAASNIPAGSFVTFASGLSVASVQGSINGAVVSAVIPAIAQGQTYVFITSKSENSTVPDADILFGPAIIEVAPPAPVIDYTIL